MVETILWKAPKSKAWIDYRKSIILQWVYDVICRHRARCVWGSACEEAHELHTNTTPSLHLSIQCIPEVWNQPPVDICPTERQITRGRKYTQLSSRRQIYPNSTSSHWSQNCQIQEYPWRGKHSVCWAHKAESLLSGTPCPGVSFSPFISLI